MLHLPRKQQDESRSLLWRLAGAVLIWLHWPSAEAAPDAGGAPARLRADDSSAAQARAFWAFQPIRTPPVPAARSAGFKIQNPVDAFVLARLREKDLRPSSPATRTELIRRLCFDLTGLPPTPEEIRAILVDTAKHLGPKGMNPQFGAGLVDPLKALRFTPPAIGRSSTPTGSLRLH